MVSSSWLIISALSIQGEIIGGVHGVDGGHHAPMMGLAMAFSPSSHARSSAPQSSSLAARLTRRGIEGRRRQQHRRRVISYASDPTINGGDIELEDTTGQIPVDETEDGSIPIIQPNRKSTADDFDMVVNARYACTRFQRHQEPRQTNNPDDDDNNNNNSTPSNPSSPAASLSDQATIQKAYECISLSRRAPTGFNAQPYRVIMVHSKKDKERLAQYCLGRNADRVRDSDCTAVFLADGAVGREGGRFADFLAGNMDDSTEKVGHGEEGDATTTATAAVATTTTKRTSRTRRTLSPKALFKLRGLILLFSSGYPLPRFLSVPLSFGVRAGVAMLSFVARCLHSLQQSSSFEAFSKILPGNIQLLPTLSSATTWSQKNTMLVAMMYMLACTSRGLATCPMEGFDASGVRKALGVPRGRYSIPLIVSTGVPHRRTGAEEEEVTDDTGVSHGVSLSPRFPLEEVVYGNAFGKPFMAT